MVCSFIMMAMERCWDVCLNCFWHVSRFSSHLCMCGERVASLRSASGTFKAIQSWDALVPDARSAAPLFPPPSLSVVSVRLISMWSLHCCAVSNAVTTTVTTIPLDLSSGHVVGLRDGPRGDNKTLPRVKESAIVSKSVWRSRYKLCAEPFLAVRGLRTSHRRTSYSFFLFLHFNSTQRWITQIQSWKRC